MRQVRHHHLVSLIQIGKFDFNKCAASSISNDFLARVRHTCKLSSTLGQIPRDPANFLRDLLDFVVLIILEQCALGKNNVNNALTYGITALFSFFFLFCFTVVTVRWR